MALPVENPAFWEGVKDAVTFLAWAIVFGLLLRKGVLEPFGLDRDYTENELRAKYGLPPRDELDSDAEEVDH